MPFTKLHTGDVIGAYTLGPVLAAGTFGVVFSCKSGRHRFALKAPRHTPEAVASLERRLEAAGAHTCAEGWSAATAALPAPCQP